jgi:hypothetical protein
MSRADVFRAAFTMERKLKWIANSLIEIETLSESTDGDQWVQITWWSDMNNDQQMTKREGKTVEEAFFSALDTAMREHDVQNASNTKRARH